MGLGLVTAPGRCLQRLRWGRRLVQSTSNKTDMDRWWFASTIQVICRSSSLIKLKHRSKGDQVEDQFSQPTCGCPSMCLPSQTKVIVKMVGSFGLRNRKMPRFQELHQGPSKPHLSTGASASSCERRRSPHKCLRFPRPRCQTPTKHNETSMDEKVESILASHRMCKGDFEF